MNSTQVILGPSHDQEGQSNPTNHTRPPNDLNGPIERTIKNARPLIEVGNQVKSKIKSDPFNARDDRSKKIKKAHTPNDD